MADTTNFEWTKPVVDGSSGAWGQILNDALDAIDTDLQAVKDTADAASDEVLDYPILPANDFAQVMGTSSKLGSVERHESTGLRLIATGASGLETTVRFSIPFRLKAGHKLTGFKSRGIAPSGTTLTVQTVLRVTSTDTEISTGITANSHGTSKATLTSSGGATSTGAGQASYRFDIEMTRTGTTITPTLYWVQPIVERA